MHKVKEMLHMDESNKDADNKHSDIKHDHGHTHSDKKHLDKDIKHDHGHSHSDKKIEEGHLSTKEFKHDHVKHGELEHGHVHTHTTEHKHHGHDLKMSGEKHIYHEREVIKGGDLYREGTDPTLKREVAAEVRHEGEVKREVVGEAKIVKEKIKEVELHKVQPVIHREREQKEIRHVVEPHQKFEVKDTKVLHKEKDIDLGTRREASTLETDRSMGHAPHIESSREVLAKERQHQELPMKVEEHVHKKIEEHIHPVIYKETLVPKVTEETHHLYEKVKEKPIETYEVKTVVTHGHDLRDAERSFFATETARGIDVDMHSHSHTHVKDKSLKKDKSHKDKSHKDKSLKDKSLKKDKHLKDHSYKKETKIVETREIPTASVVHTYPATTTTMAEPIVGHHQNIGAHHVAGAIPAGHNTAYDAALCNECTGNKVCSHGQRDAALMQTMNEKKIVKDKALEKKEGKKLKDGSSKSKKEHKNVTVV